MCSNVFLTGHSISSIFLDLLIFLLSMSFSLFLSLPLYPSSIISLSFFLSPSLSFPYCPSQYHYCSWYSLCWSISLCFCPCIPSFFYSVYYSLPLSLFSCRTLFLSLIVLFFLFLSLSNSVHECLSQRVLVYPFISHRLANSAWTSSPPSNHLRLELSKHR